MKILALEFSSQQRSVAVTDDADVLSEITTDQLKTGPLILIEQALEQAQIDREEIQCLALGIGRQLHRHSLGHRRGTGLATARTHRSAR